MTIVTDDRDRTSDSTSISEEALNQFSLSDDSLAGLIKAFHISVRDFMLLSLVCDQDCFDLDQLGRALGLEMNDVTRSVSRLSRAGLLRPDDGVPADRRDKRVCVSEDGRQLANHVLESISGSA